MVESGEPEAALGQALEERWQRAVGTFTARVDLVEDHVASLLLDESDAELHEQARNAAHKLAGTLGMFGMPAGSAVARELEEILSDPAEPDPARLTAMAELVGELRRQIEERGQPAPVRAADTPKAAPARIALVGPDRTLSESIEWICGQRGLAVERAGDGMPAPTDAAIVDAAAMTDPIPAVEQWVRAGVVVIAIAPLESFVDRAVLLRAGARVVVSESTAAAQIVDAVEDLIEQVEAGPSAVAIGIDPAEAQLMAKCFTAEGCSLLVLDDPDQLGATLATTAPDVILVGPDLGELHLGRALDVIQADPTWASGLVIALVPDDRGLAEAAPGALAAGADDVVSTANGWLPVARRVRLRAAVEALSPRRRFSPANQRQQLAARLTALLADAAEAEQPCSLLYFRLDDLRAVNAQQGYDAGDQLLRRADRFFRTFLRSTDIVGPWTGGAFVAGLTLTREVANRRLGQAIEDLASAGIACRGAVATAPDDGTDVDELVQAAESRAGRGRGPRESQAVTGDIVVVEDDGIVSELVRELLEAEGYRVRVIADGPSAVPVLTAPDVFDDVSLVLLDVTLPGLDGFGVLRAMQRANALPRLPVVMLTARTLDEEIDAALGLGAVDHVAKPFSPQVLIRRVERALALGGS